MKFDVVGRTTRYDVHPNQLNRLKRVEKLQKKKNYNKLRPIFSEAPQTEWLELNINFPTRTSGFPM